MIDHRGDELIDLEDGTFATTTFEGAYYNVDPNGIVCGVYNPDGSVPFGDCTTKDWISLDLYGRWGVSDAFEITAAITNATNGRIDASIAVSRQRWTSFFYTANEASISNRSFCNDYWGSYSCSEGSV